MTHLSHHIKSHQGRQLVHWVLAAERLQEFSSLAAPEAWANLENYLNLSIRTRLNRTIDELNVSGQQLKGQWMAAHAPRDLKILDQKIERFKKTYLRVETVLDFYADAINTRTSPEMGAMMRACDKMARKAMEPVLQPLGFDIPPVLTYLDKGLGASILKAGLRLWDKRTENPAAVIKVVRHNLMRTTSIIHESGHQVAYMIGWNDELRFWLRKRLSVYSSELGKTWSLWASEVAADTLAFAHAGYASVANLHDVVSGKASWVFRFLPGDPHPISYLRVLLGVEMCRLMYGKGPWDMLARIWKTKYPTSKAEEDIQGLLEQSLSHMTTIAKICLTQAMEVFEGRALIDLVSPKDVGPAQLSQIQKNLKGNPPLSQYLIHHNPLKLLALSGYLIATDTKNARNYNHLQRQWMLNLGDFMPQFHSAQIQ